MKLQSGIRLPKNGETGHPSGHITSPWIRGESPSVRETWREAYVLNLVLSFVQRNEESFNGSLGTFSTLYEGTSEERRETNKLLVLTLLETTGRNEKFHITFRAFKLSSFFCYFHYIQYPNITMDFSLVTVMRPFSGGLARNVVPSAHCTCSAAALQAVVFNYCLQGRSFLEIIN